MGKIKRVAELIEKCREANMDYSNTICAIQRDFNIQLESAERLYNNYISTYTGSVNHELINDGE